ncbi:MAG: aminodeoxychorismate/anthranilate synthase component II [Candidatus Obscuribacterales bacterium]
MILVIDNYDSFTYNLYQSLQALTPEPVLVRRNDQITTDEIAEMKPTHIVLSPGPGHPANARDFGVCAQVIDRQEELDCAILGVCLGHQGIGHHFGANVGRAPSIVHGKASEIDRDETPLFHGVPETFKAMRYHSLVVNEDADFPDCLQVLARDRQQKLVMAMRHKTRRLYGVQFHPESIGTADGTTILENFLTRC